MFYYYHSMCTEYICNQVSYIVLYIPVFLCLFMSIVYIVYCTWGFHKVPRCSPLNSLCSNSPIWFVSLYSLAAVLAYEDEFRIRRATRDEYQRYSQQFLKDWVKGKTPPLESISVYKITNPAQHRKWEVYKDKLSDSTIEIQYHGTKLCCNISSLQPCSNKSCGICGIARNSFDRSLIGSTISRFARFGKAFYLAPHSSKCHDYTVGYGVIRAMLCFETLPGKKFILDASNTNFVLPSGYDSAYGIPGRSLNYPELMLYNSEAALPVCIFTYTKDGIKQIAK